MTDSFASYVLPLLVAGSISRSCLLTMLQSPRGLSMHDQTARGVGGGLDLRCRAGLVLELSVYWSSIHRAASSCMHMVKFCSAAQRETSCAIDVFLLLVDSVPTVNSLFCIALNAVWLLLDPHSTSVPVQTPETGRCLETVVSSHLCQALVQYDRTLAAIT